MSLFNQIPLNLGQVSLLNAQDARFTNGFAFLEAFSPVHLLVRLEQNLFADGPSNIQSLPNGLISVLMEQSHLSKENHIQESIVESLLVKSLALFKVYDLGKVEDCLDYIEVKFAENGMVIVQAEMRYVNLNLFPSLISPILLLILNQ